METALPVFSTEYDVSAKNVRKGFITDADLTPGQFFPGHAERKIRDMGSGGRRMRLSQYEGCGRYQTYQKRRDFAAKHAEHEYSIYDCSRGRDGNGYYFPVI